MEWRGLGQECLWFVAKQAHACLFGGFLLAVMIATRWVNPFTGVHRYDVIFLAAVACQILLVVTGLESRRELRVTVAFHLMATVMELFKTSDAIGSWSYPEPWVFGIGNVPLFTGFLYSAVGSYLVRAWRLLDFRFTGYPPARHALWLIAAIYLNFFGLHYIWDLRWALLAATVWLFRHTWIHFRPLGIERRVPLLLGWVAVAALIWSAENIATYVDVWRYPHQQLAWQMVSLGKLGSWYLLMLVSFVLVALVQGVRAPGLGGHLISGVTASTTSR